jgi:hypothetical protein
MTRITIDIDTSTVSVQGQPGAPTAPTAAQGIVPSATAPGAATDLIARALASGAYDGGPAPSLSVTHLTSAPEAHIPSAVTQSVVGAASAGAAPAELFRPNVGNR